MRKGTSEGSNQNHVIDEDCLSQFKRVGWECQEEEAEFFDSAGGV
jgi:hypothetical protein